MAEALLSAIGILAQPEVMVYMLLGTLLGFVLGALPGLGALQGLVLVLPFTFGMDPRAAMFLYAGIMGAGPLGGAIPAILLRIPGTSVNIATVLDGYPMAQQGKSAQALGISAAASGLGAFFGLFVLIAMLPAVRAIVMSFGPPEMFMLVIFGLSATVIVSKGNLLKGLIAACLGIALSFVGPSNVSGITRFGFDSILLRGGIPLVPFFIGLFGIGQILKLSMSGEMAGARAAVTGGGFRQVMEGAREVFRHKVCFLRSSAIGTVIGIIPGIGGAVANFLAYLVTQQSSRHPETFGTGRPEGVVATESSNNACQGGAMLTAFAFGIPGGLETALLLGIFILHGLTPGPMLIRESLDVVWALIIGFFVANILVSGVVLVWANRVAAVNRLNMSLVMPIVVVVIFIGLFILRGEVMDIFLALIFGLLAYAMEKYGFSVVALTIGFILGELAEVSFHRSLAMAWGSYTVFFTRPISLALFVLVLLTLSLPFLQGLLARRKARARS